MKYILSIVMLLIFSTDGYSWGSDIIIPVSINEEYKQPKLSQAFNGDLYVSRLQKNNSGRWTIYQIFRSTDLGQKWELFKSGTTRGEFYSFDLLTAGTNEQNFRVFMAAGESHNTTGTSLLVNCWDINGEEMNINIPLEEINISDRGITSVCWATDVLLKNKNAEDYSINLSIAKSYSNSDSIITFSSQQGTSNFVRNAIYGTTKKIRNIHCAIGKANDASSIYGMTGIVWDEYNLYTDVFGDLKCAMIYPHNGAIDTIYNVGGPILYAKNPTIAMSLDNDRNDIRAVITYDIMFSIYNKTVSSRFTDDVLFNKTGFSGNTPLNNHYVYGLDVETEKAHVKYDPYNKRFIYTAYNVTNNSIMYHTKDLNSPIEVAPELDFDRIKDAVSSPSRSPSPKIDFTNNASGVIVCWDEDNIIYLDFESHTVKIPVNNKEDFNVKIYPVPAKDLINCSFNLNTTGEISFEVYSILGQLQIKENAVFNKGTVYKSIDVSNLPSGQYALVLKQSANQCTKFFTVN